MDSKQEVQEASGNTQAGPGRETEALSAPVVLVVDDEEMIRQFAGFLLTMEGIRVLAAGSEDEAVAQAEGFPGRIDLMLADVRLRQGSGPGAAARVAQVRQDMGIVFMSGYSRIDLLKQRLIGPEDVFLPKPFDVTAFRAIFRK